MVRAIGRVILSSLMVLQAVHPALANEWIEVNDSCGCATECSSCEEVAIESEPCGDCATEMIPTDDCSCGEVQAADQVSEPLPTMETTAAPLPAETQKPETYAPTTGAKPTEAAPQTETPAPALETIEEALPPAPIGVPSDSTTNESKIEQILPGPAPTETTPSEKSAVGPRYDTEGLFDEPAATGEPESTPPPAIEEPASTEPPTESTDTEGLFDEPTPSAEERNEASTESALEEQPETETQESEEAEPAADPLDDLFNSPSPTTEPAPESEPESPDESEEEQNIDPFSQLPSELKAVGGLASREYRVWSNHATSVRYEARLVGFSTKGATLSKESGELVAVPFSQLNDNDLTFVRDQVRAQRFLLARTASANQVASQVSP